MRSEKINAVRQGIISIDGYTENCMKLRTNAADKSTGNAKDKAIADAYGDSETDYVTKLRSTITTESSILQ